MMFICQKCGWREFPCWRNHKWIMYATYCKLDELASFQPELAKKFETSIEYEDEQGYFYHYVKKANLIIRLPADLKQWFKRGHMEEKFRKFTGQTKLLEKETS